MKLSISNIGWSADQDIQVYELMKKCGYAGLEIAPTRIFPETPYDKIPEAAIWSREIKAEYGFVIPSMQSIWYGKQEKVFGSEEERKILIDYTKKAIDFAAAINCKNLVFGCPGNRNLLENENSKKAIEFFKELGDYAATCGTVIGMEANPPIYNTNYINSTEAALELIAEVDSAGFLLNLDVGTMIQNQEEVSELIGKVGLINHVHISEPGLKAIEESELHMELKKILADGGYKGFISIEMGKVEDIAIIENSLRYVKSIFG